MCEDINRNTRQRPRRGDEFEQDPDDFWQADASLPTGTIQQLTEYPKKRRVRRRPIGFLANIDEEIED